MSEWEWNPDTYLAEMAAEIPGYEELQEAVVAAATGVRATRVLELGTGTGETALRVRAEQPGASWVGIDASEAMLARARERLPDADLRLARLEDELPAGPVRPRRLGARGAPPRRCGQAGPVRACGPACCGRAASSSSATSSCPRRAWRGRFTIDWVMDMPDSVDDQLAWLREAGFEAEASSVRVDLAVFRARLNSP